MKRILFIHVMALCCAVQSQAQSFRTVTFSGNSSDFNAAEKYTAQGTAQNTDYYVTFDASNLYIGAFRTGGSTFGSTDNFTIYIDTDPASPATGGTGTTAGQSYNGVTGTLPFTANYNVHAEQSYQEARSFASTWASTITGVTYWTSTTAREVKIPFSSIGSPDALYLTMWMGYANGFFANAPGTNIAAAANPTITGYIGGFGVTSADCIPINTTNTAITASITNAVPTAGAVYGKVTVNTGTITNTGAWTLAPGGSIQVTGGTLAFGAQTVTFGNAASSAGKGTTINTTGTGAITTTASTIWDFGGEGNITGNALSTSGAVRIRQKFTPLASGGFTIASGGNLDIRNGGFVSTNAPTYASGSFLMYNSGTTYVASTEWTPNAASGAGVPSNVTIGNNIASSVCSFGTSSQYRQMLGNLLVSNTTLGAGLTLSTVAGGDLKIGGNWTNSGTFTANSRAVYFNGTAAQAINATATGFAYLFISNTSANVTATAAVTATASLTVDANARLDMAANTLTLTGSTSTVNGALRSAGTFTGATTTTLTFSSTGTYEHNSQSALPIATWSSGSTCAIIGWAAGTTAPTNLNQTFHHFTWNSPSQSSTLNMVGNPTTINGNFSVLSTGTGILRWGTQVTATVGGNLIITSNGTNSTLQTNNSGTASTINVGGNFIITQTTNVATFAHSGTGTTTVNFNRATSSPVQVFSSNGTISGPISWNVGTGTSTNIVQLGSNVALGTGTGTFTVANNATMDFQTFVLSGSGTTTAATGATLLTANTAGINTSGATGSVQTTTRTFTNTGVNYSYNGATAQTAGTAIGAAASIANLTVNNSAGVTLSANVQSLTGTLTLTSGNLTLSTFNLTLGSAATVSGAASNKYIQTNNTGQLRRTALTSAFIFPVGNSAYNPISIANTGTSDDYGVRVVDGALANANASTLVVNRAWVVTEAVSGASALTVIPQYNSGEEASGYNAGTTPYVGFWNGSTWSQVSATLAGSNPFTATAGAAISPSNLTTGTQYFAIGKDNGLLQAAIDYTWNGSTSNDWGTTTNWTPNGVPGSSDNVTISSPGTNTLSINSARTVINFTVSGTGNFTTTSAGSLTITGTISSSTSATPSLNCASTLTISNGSSQTIPAWNYGNLNASGGARILASSGTIGICGTFTPGAGAYTVTGSTVDFNGTGAQTINAITYNNLTISGNRGAAAITLPSGTITVGGNGSYTGSNATWVNTGNTVVYNGAGAQTVAAIPGYNNLTISGARGSATVTLESGTIGVAGTFSPTATAVSYSSTGNTFDYTSTGAQSIVAFNKYNNLSNSGNGARTLPTAATVVIDGTYTPTTGAITVSTSVIDFSSASSQSIPASSYYSITNSGNGNRVWASSGNIDINGTFTPGTGTHTITGSTMRFLNTTAGPFTIPVVTTNVSGSSYNNVVINGSNATPSVYSTAGTTMGIAGDLTITAGHLRMSTGGASGTLNVNGTLTMNGGSLVLTNSGTVTDVGTLNLFGNLVMSSGTIGRTSSVANAFINFAHPTATQSWTYSGGSFSILSGLGIPVNVGTGSTTNTLSLASNVSASSITVNVLSGSTLNFGTNVFASTGAMVFVAANGSNLITANAGGFASSGATGSVQSTGGRTFNVGANYTYNGSVAQATGTGMTGANNLIFNNTSGANPAITLSASAAVTGTLTLTSGIVQLGANNLTVSNTASGAITGGSSTSFIQNNSTGELRRGIAGSISASTTYNYPVGTSTNYTPASFTFSATGNAFTLHTRAVAGTHPSMNVNGTQTDFFANRYWATNTSGTPSTYSYTSAFNYVSGDQQGTVGNIRLNKWSGSWSMDTTSTSTSTVLTSGSLNETSFSLASTAEWTGRFNPTIQTYTWLGTTNSSWTEPSNWSPGTSVAGPAFIDNVIINAPGTNTLNITGTTSITNMTVSGTGTFTVTSGDTLVVIGSITNSTSATPSLACGSLVQMTSSASQTIPAWNFGDLDASGGDRVLASSGIIGMCGTFTRGAGAYTITGSTIDFNGTGAQTIPVGTYNNLTISQNRGGAAITLGSGTIDVAGSFNPTVSNNTVVITGNTINFSSASAQTIPAFNYNTITNTGNGNRTWASSGTIDVNNTFSPGTGTQTVTGSTVRYSSTAATAYTLTSFTSSASPSHYNNLELVGGASTTWSLASGFNMGVAGNFSLTGAGTFTVASNATANTMTVGGNMTLSGTGNIRIANTATGSLTNSITVTGNTVISNGILTAVGSTSAAGVTGNLTTTDLTISGTGQFILDAANNSAAGSATVNGNFSLTSTTTNAVNFGSGAGSNANNLINIKGNFAKSGTGTIGMTGGFATTAGFNFNGTTTQTWSHGGTAMTGGTITVAAGATVQLLSNMTSASSASANAITVAGTLDCGSFAIAASNATNTFVLSATGLLKTASATGVAGTITGFTTLPAFTTGASFEFSGTNPSTGFSTFTGITTANAYTINWTGTGGLTLDKAVQLNALNLTNNGLFYIGNFDVTMASGATIGGSPFSSSKMIVTNGTGYLVRSHTAAGVGIPFTWPIGDTTGVAEYSPVTVNNISVALAGTLAYRVVDGVHPNMSPATVYASRYWPSRYTGSTYNYTNATFTYAAADIVTGPESSFGANVWDPVNSAWIDFSATSTATGNMLTVTSGPTSTNMPAGATQFDFTPRVAVPIYYRSVTTGNWTTASTWEISSDPNFVSPAAVAATFGPNAANSNGVLIRNGHTVTANTAMSNDQVTIESGGILSITNNAFTIANGTGADMQINSGGTLQISAGLSASMVLASGGAMQVDGLFKMTGTGTNPTVSAVGTITVGATGTYEHNVNAGTIPTCTWQSGSTCLVTGTTSTGPGGLGQSFHHFTVNTTLTTSVNCSGALQTINGKFKVTTNSATLGWRLTSTTPYTLNVADSLIITNGILDAVSGTLTSSVATVNANGPVVMNGSTSQFTKSGPSTAVININNNFTQNAGIIEFNAGGSSNTTWNIKGDFVQGGAIQRTNGGTHTLNFNKASGVQTWTQTGTFGAGALTINAGNSTTNTLQLLSNIALGSSAQVFNVTNGATLDMGPYVMTGASSTFAVGATGAVKFGSVDGITTAPTAAGNVQTQTRTFPATASYFYNGTSNQVTGNALPTTLTGTGNLNIQSSTGVTVTLSATRTTPTLNLISGLFAAGAGQQLNISANGTVNATSGDFATGANAGVLNFVTGGTGTFSGNCNPYNVYTSGGVNFGTGTVTIANGGTFRINAGGFVSTNAPFYASGSTLQYFSASNYGRDLEWSATSGRGYPHHVQISNNTVVNPANTGATKANVPLRTAGNLTIDNGSALYMDFSSNNMIEDLVVSGNLTLTGAMSASQTSGADIYVGGDWTNDGTAANFFPNSRGVFLNGSGTQTISGTNASFPTYPYLLIDKTAGVVNLSRDIQVTTQLTFTSANTAIVDAGSYTVYVSGSATTSIDRQGSGHVVGNLRRAITTGSNTYAYPIGDATNYTPVSTALNNVTVAGSITAKSNAGDHPQIASSGIDGSKSVNRYYSLTNTGATLTSFDATFTFVAGDIDSGANTANFLVGGYNSGWTYPTIGSRTATTTQATSISSFGEFAIAECKAPSAFNLTGGGSYCSGSGGVDVGLDDSELGIGYQLKLDGVDIGANVVGTGSAISFGNQTSGGIYTAVASSLATSGCSNNMTGNVTVTVNPVVNPSVSIVTATTTICAGTSVTFDATAQFGGTSPAYQWTLNGSNVGTNSSSYSSSTLANGDIVACTLTSSEACPSPTSVTSNTYTMIVLAYETPTVTISASPSTTGCEGDMITFSASNTFGGSTPVYSWLLNGASVGTNNENYSTINLANGNQIQCVLTSDYLCLTTASDSSNTITMTIVTPPQVDAGSNMTTCGTTAFTFANGATNSNTTSIAWTENGAGSITAGANTLTPTYTPAAGDLGTTVTFTLTGYGNSPCAEIADNVTLQIDALTLYYDDDDNDGFGDALSSPVASCTPITGKASNNTDCCDTNADINPMSEWWADADGDGVGGFIYTTGCVSGCSGFASTIPYYPGAHGGAPYSIDCNDASSTAYPGATELCGNASDDDCDQMIDEGCSGIVNDGFAYATLMNVNSTNAYYPNCLNVNGSVLNADVSSEGNPANVAVGGGRDSWYRFVAPSSAARIQVVPSGFDAVIELRTAAHPVGQVDVENANATVGGTEIMNVSGLTIGQTYYIAVRNYGATTGGTFTICTSPLMPSGCGTAQPTGGYSLCTSYKAVYRGATSYTFNFTGAGGTAPTPFVTTSATVANGLITLSNSLLALRNGGVYNIRVDANYTLLNGVGVADPTITILGPTTNCLNRTIAAAPLLEVRSTQRCPVTLFRSTYLAATPVSGNTTACGAIAYNYRFTRVTDCTGITTSGSPFVVTTPNASAFLSLYAAFPNSTYPLPNLGYWRVEVAPVFSYGATAYGPPQVIQVNNTASSTMLPEEAIAAERSETIVANIELYPNPGDGGRVIVSAPSEMPITQWAIFDELGRKVEGYQVIPMDDVHYELVFENSLASGLYYITWQADSEMQNRKWVVNGK